MSLICPHGVADRLNCQSHGILQAFVVDGVEVVEDEQEAGDHDFGEEVDDYLQRRFWHRQIISSDNRFQKLSILYLNPQILVCRDLRASKFYKWILQNFLSLGRDILAEKQSILREAVG